MPTETVPISKSALWTGRILSTLAALFLLFDAVLKLLRLPLVLQTMGKLGYPESVIHPLGAVLLLCVLVYLFPRTSVLGTILLTGYLGGAVATHVRASDPLFSHALFPVYLGVILWLGLYPREPRLRTLLPFRR